MRTLTTFTPSPRQSRVATGRQPRPRQRPKTHHVTARLQAARLEVDGTIQLRIADPNRPGTTRVVSFPGLSPDATTGTPAMSDQLSAARSAFIDEIVLPSFEGWVLLYGLARLTLIDPDGYPAEAEAGEALSTPWVLEFEALESAPPALNGAHAFSPFEARQAPRAEHALSPVA